MALETTKRCVCPDVIKLFFKKLFVSFLPKWDIKKSQMQEQNMDAKEKNSYLNPPE